MENSYFQFVLLGDNDEDEREYGKCIFQDEYNKSCLATLIFSFVTDNKNLDDIELFYKVAGFNTIRKEEIPNGENIKEIYLYRRDFYHIPTAGITDVDSAHKYIEFYFGLGFINKFRTIKIERLPLLEHINDNPLDYYVRSRKTYR